jgi:ATP-dependent helicase/nuclease subunit A
LRTADAHARRRAVTCFDRPLALEAGAGTGKTSTLVARIVAWCLGPGWERALVEHPGESLERIARRVASGVFAITFTEAAASEMLERTASALGRVARRERLIGLEIADPEAYANRATHLVSAVDLLEISTIHAFCMRVLRDQSIGLGLHPGFQLDADGEATAALARAVVAERWPDLLDGGDRAALALARRAVGAQHLVDGLVELAGSGVVGDELAGATVDPTMVRAAFREACEELHGALAGLEFPKGLTKPPLLRDALADWLAAEPLDDAASDLVRASAGIGELAKEPRTWRKGVDALQKGLRKVGDEQRIVAASQRWCEAFDVFESYDPAHYGAAAAVLAPLLDEVVARRRREGWLGFDDLLAEAARWARAGGAGVEAWRRRIRQLLVDEFQDTDVRQCDLVEALALRGPLEERPGLFVVGDPKQSIYGWRAADLSAYEGLLERLRAEGGEVHTLSVNFRSSQAILDEVERMLVPHLVHEPGVQAAFAPLVAPERGGDAPPPVGSAALEYWTTWVTDPAGAPTAPSSPRTTAIEAAALAADIVARRAADPSLRHDHIAVLMRTTTDQEVVLRSLREAGVPFSVAKERSFWHHREVRDAALHLCAVLDRSDEVALVATLRSPHTGMPDGAFVLVWEELLALARTLGGGDDAPALARLDALLRDAARRLSVELPGAAVSPHWPALVLEQLAALGALRRAWRTATLTEFMELVRASNAAGAGEAARRLGRFRSNNFERFHAQFEERVRATNGDTLELLRFLRSRRDEPGAAEPQRPEGDAVLVSTIHGAKGLEFPVVYLVSGHKGRRTSDGATSGTTRARRDRHGLALSLLGFAGLGYTSAMRRMQRIEEAELARLLYVAVTRAKTRLVVAASAGPDHRLGDKAPGSFAEALGHRRPAELRAHFETVSTVDAQAELVDAHGVVWRFTRASAVPPVSGLEADERIDLARVAADVASLAAARRVAAERAAAPLALPASADLPELAREPEQPEQPEARPRAEAAAGSDGELGAGSGAAARAASLVGTRLHLLLAARTRGDRSPAAFERARAALDAELAGEVRAAALARFDEVARALAQGPLLARLDALCDDDSVDGPHVEVPVLVAAGAGDAPASHYSGAADLVLRDERGWAVVDFKTDRLGSEAERDARAAHYAPQLERYAVAVQRALGLAQRPRRELWWLERGEISVLA